MDNLTAGLLYGVSRRCDQIAQELARLHDALPDDPRADPARALARRQQSRMAAEATDTERLADAVLELASDSVEVGPADRPWEMSRYRHAIVLSRFVEHNVIPFLRAFNEQAIELTNLCKRIAETVNWPGRAPLVAPGATGYFFFISESNEDLVLAPALAGSSPLPLPDLVHEMAHPLFVPNSDQRETLLGDWHGDDYVRGRVASVLANPQLCQLATRHWLAHGVEEIACDAIAAFVCGPAYAWQHIRWCCGLRDGASVFEGGDNHPPDGIRFEVVMRVLADIAEPAELEALTTAWSAVISLSENLPPSEADQLWKELYPPALVLELADEVIRGCVRAKIHAFPNELKDNDPRRVFHDAWREMRNDPRGYHDRSRSERAADE